MRVIFDETNDFERHFFPTDSYLKSLSSALISKIPISIADKESANITALLPYPRSNIYHEIASGLGELDWVKFADTAEFREEELIRWFGCYAPHVLIGNKEFLEKVQTLPEPNFVKLQAVISIDEAVRIRSAKTYLWKANLTHHGVEQTVTYVD